MSNKHTEEDQWPKKAYKNLAFLNSTAARQVRILSEFMEPECRFRKNRIHDTIVFFGSARIKERAVARKELRAVERSLPGKKTAKKTDSQEVLLQTAKQAVQMSKYYEDARKLSKRLTEWSISLGRGKRRFIIASGGGPGIMEAANRGASDVRNGYTIGLNISLPFEQSANPYITRDLNLSFIIFLSGNTGLCSWQRP